MGIEKVGVDFYDYCCNNRFLKVLLPINIPLLFIMAILKIIQNFISFGSAANTIIYIVFILSILLTFAKSEYRILSIGIGIYAFDYIINILRSLFKYHSLNWGSIIYLIFWGFIAYKSYKKSLRTNS